MLKIVSRYDCIAFLIFHESEGIFENWMYKVGRGWRRIEQWGRINSGFGNIVIIENK